MTNVSIHRFFPYLRQGIQATALGIIILVVGAISPPPTPTRATTPAAVPPAGERLATALGQVSTLWGSVVQRPPGPLVAITYYQADDTCSAFGERRAVAHPDHPEQIVATILANPNLELAGLDLAGYTVTRPAPDTLALEFTLAPDSPRQLQSLSACEQFMLLGSLDRTLRENPALGITTLEFRQNGLPLIL